MKQFLISLILLFVTISAFATIGPFHPHEAKKFKEIEDNAVVITKEFVYDAEAVTAAASKSYDLGQIPAKSAILSTMFYIDEAITNNANTIAFSCESSGDLFSATDISAEVAGTMYNGALNFPNTASASLTTTTTGCTVQADVGAGAGGITDGYLLLIVKFFNFDL